MYFPRYWAKESRPARAPSGKMYHLTLWGWSDQDAQDARQVAIQRLAELARKVEAGGRLDHYGYPADSRPLREPVIRDVPGAEAVVSRNVYGALILNTARVLITDIDFPETTFKGLLARLVGKKPPDHEAAALARLREWHAMRPDWSLRVYRTKAGLRLLATHDLFDPAAPQTQQLLTSLNSDRLYVTLCRTQACFRARLTPKPWRIGLRAPLGRYPFSTTYEETRFQAWLQRYEAAAPGYAVCRLLAELGPRSPVGEATAVVGLHDRYTMPGGELPLA